jgi:hypothetical protein
VRGNTDVFLSTHGDFAKDKTIQTKMEVDWAKGVEGSVKKGLEAIETRQSATKSASEFQVAGGHKDGRAEAETKL